MLTYLQTDPEWEEQVWEDFPDEEPLCPDAEPDGGRKENPLLLYLRDMARYPLLTREDEAELAREIQQIQESLVRLFMGIPISLREIDRLKRGIGTDREGKEKALASKADLITQVLLRLRRIDAETAKNHQMTELLDQIHQLESRLRDAFTRMVQSNLRLVVSISKHHLNRGLSLADLIQEGNIGLMKAITRFDPNRDLRFSTYATWWIRQAIYRAIEMKGRTIRMPVHMFGALNRYRRVMHRWAGELSPERIVEKGRLSQGQWRVLQNLIEEPLSLEVPARDGDARLIDLLPDRKSVSPSEAATRKELSEKLRKALKMLPPREEGILKQRFGIDHGRPYTLDEIGRQLGLSRERVRQIEKKALLKLEKEGREKDLQKFL